MMKMKDLTNQKFGDLIVIEQIAGGRPTVNGVRKRQRIKYLCKCKCGNECEVFSNNLIRGNSTSCGCKFINSKKYNFVDLSGQTFGNLTILKRSEALTKTRGALWMCKCSCGREVEISSNGLTSGNNITCGNRDEHYRSERVGEIPIFHINAIRNNAIKRNLSFTVEPDYLWNLFITQERICQLSGVILCFTDARDASNTGNQTTASLDRIDNSKGYDVGNVRWVHKNINIMRGANTDEEFLNWCHKCIDYHEKIKGIPSWNRWFLDQCEVIKRRSKDKHTKFGCVIANQDHRILSQGYNSFPSGINDNVPERYERDLKYSYIVHAEENAICSAARAGISLKNACIYVSALPCITCSRMIIQAGIIEVIIDAYRQEEWGSKNIKYASDFQKVKDLFIEGNVKLIEWLD